MNVFVKVRMCVSLHKHVCLCVCFAKSLYGDFSAWLPGVMAPFIGATLIHRILYQAAPPSPPVNILPPHIPRHSLLLKTRHVESYQVIHLCLGTVFILALPLSLSFTGEYKCTNSTKWLHNRVAGYFTITIAAVT